MVLASCRLLGWCGFFFGEVTKLYRHRISFRILKLGFVDVDGFWKDGTLDFDLVLGILLDVVEEEAFDAALMNDNLLKARKANDGIGDTV